MANTSGLFLALEGTDGSGKATQLKMLASRLIEQGYQVHTVQFPRYQQPSSYFVRRYLKGIYGQQNEVGPYTSSLFFALDRFEAAKEIKHALAEGKIVLADRFTGSNMAQQGAKIAEAEQRRGFFLWLDNLEFEMLKIPRPDKSLVLRVTAEISSDLLAHRQVVDGQTSVDIHEADTDYLSASIQAYEDLCQLFPKDFRAIDCVRDNKLLDQETIHRLIWQNVEPDLPPLASVTTEKPYHILPGLPKETADLYQRTMEVLLATHADITTKLTGYNQGLAEPFDANLVQSIAESILPLAVGKTMTTYSHGLETQNQLIGLAGQFLPTNYEEAADSLKLIRVMPRNELDLVETILYPYAQTSSDKLAETLAKMPYSKKETILKAYLATKNETESNSALQEVQYSWDILSSYQDMTRLVDLQPGSDFQPQLISPRHGYDVPDLIEQTGLTDQFLACFDASLELYSALQAAHGDKIAQYAALQGHRLRWRVTYNVVEMVGLLNQPSDKLIFSEKGLLIQMRDKMAETHPLIGETLFLQT